MNSHGFQPVDTSDRGRVCPRKVNPIYAPIGHTEARPYQSDLPSRAITTQLKSWAKKERNRPPEEEKQEALATISSMQANLDKLKPVIDAHDQEYNDLQKREEEMDKLIREFKNSLLIEKIKMDTWERRRR